MHRKLLRDQSDYTHNITGILATYSENDDLVDTIAEQHYVFGGDGINYRCLCQNSGSVQGVYVTYNVYFTILYTVEPQNTDTQLGPSKNVQIGEMSLFQG